VTLQANIGSYLGVPILLQDGTMFGTLCALDSEPYSFRQYELEAVQLLAQFLAHALDLEAVAATHRLKSAALEATANAVAITERDGRLLWVNQAYTHLTGYTLEAARTANVSLLGTAEPSRTIQEVVSESGHYEGEQLNRRQDGTPYFETVTITPVKDATGDVGHYISIQQDVTIRKQYEEGLYYLAHFDTLTHLPNRTLFHEKLVEALRAAEATEEAVAVLLLDLDRFKNINDTLGHNMGDQLLVAAATRLQDQLELEDVVARASGDEFTLLVRGFDEVARVAETAERMRAVLSEPYHIEGYELYSTPSIGIALYPQDGQDADTLLKLADTAMYAAKAGGRNSVVFYQVNMTDSGRLDLETHLHHALEKGEFELHYQPKIELTSGRVLGMEALLRWRNPELGWVPPDVFIPVAEDSGLIGPIGDWVLRTACEQNRAWQDAGHDGLCVAVNVSVSQFQYTNLVDRVSAILTDTGLAPATLELEITESLIIQDTEQVIRVLHDLKTLGVQISIDDFGTGYSSLRYLKMLPVDTLKIDRSFVKDITGPCDDECAIAKAVISLGHSLRLHVIAEGVETEAQMEFLRHEQCDAVQGYWYSRPLPAEAFTEWLEARLVKS